MNQQVKDTIKQMNDWGKNGEPFLFLINFDLEKAEAFSPEYAIANDIWVSMPGFTNRNKAWKPSGFHFYKTPVDYPRYQRAFNRAMNAINRGDTFLLNLTFPTSLDTNLTIGQIFDAGNARYRMKYKDQFVVFSPEPFISIKGNTIATFPMKGTIDASVEDAENKLLTDKKEIAEHNTIVDLLRNDLNMVSKKVKVSRFRYIERIKTHERELLQTSSTITGELEPGWNKRVGDILLKLLPAGSISGAPKMKTVEIIRDAEGYDRGWFTGIFGYFDGTGLETAVMIRFIENRNGKFIFKSGGGITHFSTCEQEYRELIEKVYLPF